MEMLGRRNLSQEFEFEGGRILKWEVQLREG